MAANLLPIARVVATRKESQPGHLWGETTTVYYLIRVVSEGPRTYRCERRYSEFHSLYASLCASEPDAAAGLPPLPPRRLLVHGDSVVVERIESLDGCAPLAGVAASGVNRPARPMPALLGWPVFVLQSYTVLNPARRWLRAVVASGALSRLSCLAAFLAPGEAGDESGDETAPFDSLSSWRSDSVEVAETTQVPGDPPV